MIRASIGVVLAAATALWQSPAPVFHGATDAVALDVAVFDGDRVITHLRPADFDVRDNGVRQTVTSADFNTLPIDLRLVFDTSGSISDEDLEQYLHTMQRVASTLQPRDRCEIMTFTTSLADAAALQSPPVAIKLVRAGPEGTAFFDAAVVAMITKPMTDRRQITILLSDAIDNSSFFDEAALLDAAGHTDAVVYTILPGDPRAGRAVSKERLQSLSLLTGGRLVLTHQNGIASAIIDSIQEFRQSYVVRYVVTGVPVTGWHKVDVRVPGGVFYRVRVKPGYFGR
jgi:VWFA-related protein